jgi:hypothetical protein
MYTVDDIKLYCMWEIVYIDQCYSETIYKWAEVWYCLAEGATKTSLRYIEGDQSTERGRLRENLDLEQKWVIIR